MTTNIMLPFQETKPNGTVDAWCVQPTGDYDADCAQGNLYFQRLLQRVDETSNHLLLTHTIACMVEKGRISGVEIGFLHSMSVHTV